MKVCIDAGHGGTDTGAVGHGLVEKQINIIIALKTEELVRKNGIQTLLTHVFATDTLSLEARCKMSNDFGANLFVSIHHNANNGKTNGYEAIHSIYYGKGTDFAKILGQEFEKIGRKPDMLGIYSKPSEVTPSKDYYAVIRGTDASAVISEYCYIDSDEYKLIDDYDEQIAEAYAIAKAICRWAGVDFKDPCAPEPIKVVPPTPIEPAPIVEPTPVHWAEANYNNLIKYGIMIYEKRYDDKITRGEVFKLLDEVIQLLKR